MHGRNFGTLQHLNRIVRRARVVLAVVTPVAAWEMARPISATRMLWESTCCVLLQRTLTQRSRSKSNSKFLILGLLQSSYRSHSICPICSPAMSLWHSIILALRWLFVVSARRKDHMLLVSVSWSYTGRLTTRKA